MQFLALSRRRAERCCEVDFHLRLEAEAGLVSDLRRAGIIRKIWRRGDAPGECLLIEARSAEAARAILEAPPFSDAGQVDIELVVPLRSYAPGRQGHRKRDPVR